MNFEEERTTAIHKEKFFLNDSLNKKVEVIEALNACAVNISNRLKTYQTKLRELGMAVADLAMETSRYYNKECVYRADIETFATNYDKYAGTFMNRANLLDKHSVLIEEIYSIYNPVNNLLKEFKAKRKNYNHYTEKLAKLEREKQIFEDQGTGNYSKKDLEKLLRKNEKKLMLATLELERHEKSFDESTDSIFIKRFTPINKILALITHEEEVSMVLSAPLIKQSSDTLKKFPGYLDNFKAYKVGVQLLRKRCLEKFNSNNPTGLTAQRECCRPELIFRDQWANRAGEDITEQGQSKGSGWGDNSKASNFDFDFFGNHQSHNASMSIATSGVSTPHKNSQAGSAPLKVAPSQQMADDGFDLFSYNPSPVKKPAQAQSQSMSQAPPKRQATQPQAFAQPAKPQQQQGNHLDAFGDLF